MGWSSILRPTKNHLRSRSAKGVIKGFEEGILGMKVGGRRKVTIPYQLAYGESGRPPVIPRMTTLVFEIQLVAEASNSLPVR